MRSETVAAWRQGAPRRVSLIEEEEIDRAVVPYKNIASPASCGGEKFATAAAKAGVDATPQYRHLFSASVFSSALTFAAASSFEMA